MKILIVTTSFIRSSDDYYSYFIYEQAESIKLENPSAEVRVLAPHQFPFKRKETINGIQVIRFPYFFPFKLQKLAYQTDGLFKTVRRSLLALFQLPLFLASMLIHLIGYSRDCDIIHAQWIPTGFVALPLKLFRNIKIIVSVRGSDLHGLKTTGISKKIHCFLLNRLDAILTVSEDFYNIIKHRLRVDTLAVPLFNGVDTRHFRQLPKEAAKNEWGIKDSDPLILFVGNIVSHKGIDTLIRAFSITKSSFPNCKLLLAGEGPEMNQFLNFADQFNIRGSIKFLGLVAREKIPSLMSAAEMLVLPSLGEGRPNVVLEAMACKLPVLATDVGGTRELLSHGISGLLFEPGDVQSLSDHMVSILKDPAKSKLMSQKAYYSLTEKELTWLCHGRKLNHIYKSILSQTKNKEREAVCAASQD